MALSVGSYVGDGLNPRRLRVVAFEPICTWVWGADGGGLNLGSFKIRGMADGVSHPWAKNPATGAASRADRILSLNSDGFTVGPDLNVLGRTYQYINWPLSGGVTGYGSYGGNGWSLAGGATLTTTAGVFAATGSFRAVDVGQTFRRISDGAIIGVATGFVNANQMTGSIAIASSFAPFTWEFVPRQIPLGFAPDFWLLCALSSLPEAAGTAVTPVMGCPGRDISDIVAHDQDVIGDGRAPATAFVRSGSENLEVYNASSLGAGGMNGSGITYVWFAFKALGLTAIPIDKIDYTGDGTFPRSLHGTTFAPELVIVTGSITSGSGFSAQPHWHATGSVLTPGEDARRFADGGAPIGAQFTLLPDGITYGNNGLNVAGQLYRAFFLMPGVDPPVAIGIMESQLVEACSAFSVCPCPSPC